MEVVFACPRIFRGDLSTQKMKNITSLTFICVILQYLSVEIYCTFVLSRSKGKMNELVVTGSDIHSRNNTKESPGRIYNCKSGGENRQHSFFLRSLIFMLMFSTAHAVDDMRGSIPCLFVRNNYGLAYPCSYRYIYSSQMGLPNESDMRKVNLKREKAVILFQ